jgi:hypothetical protein
LVARKNRKEKMFSFSFFPAKTFLIRQLVLQIHSYVYVVRVCVVCYAEGRDIPTLSRMWFSTEQTPFIERYFLASKNLFSAMTTDTRIISFLCLLREASTVLCKSKLFPHEQSASLLKRVPTFLLWLSVTLCVVLKFVCC